MSQGAATINQRFSGRRQLILICFALSLLASNCLAEPISITGYTEAVQDSTLGVVVTGRVEKILVKPGDRVKRGQKLIELEQGLEQHEVDRRKLIGESKVEMNAVSRQLVTLDSQFVTHQQLQKNSGSVAIEEIENQQLAKDLARIDLERLRVAEKREQFEYQFARQQLLNKTICAPFAGQVVDILVEVGENCDLDTPLLRLVNPSQILFVANTELALSQRLAIGQEVDLVFQAGTELVKHKAKITFISPVVDPASGLRKIMASFDNQDQKITPGESGVMQIQEPQS